MFQAASGIKAPSSSSSSAVKNEKVQNDDKESHLKFPANDKESGQTRCLFLLRLLYPSPVYYCWRRWRRQDTIYLSIKRAVLSSLSLDKSISTTLLRKIAPPSATTTVLLTNPSTKSIHFNGAALVVVGSKNAATAAVFLNKTKMVESEQCLISTTETDTHTHISGSFSHTA
jgi:hypothetical protein